MYLLKESGHNCVGNISRKSKWGQGHFVVSISNGATAPPYGHIYMIAKLKICVISIDTFYHSF